MEKMQKLKPLVTAILNDIPFPIPTFIWKSNDNSIKLMIASTKNFKEYIDINVIDKIKDSISSDDELKCIEIVGIGVEDIQQLDSNTGTIYMLGSTHCPNH